MEEVKNMSKVIAVLLGAIAALTLGAGTAQAQCQVDCNSQGYCVTNCW
jgi:hypothetical protein